MNVLENLEKAWKLTINPNDTCSLEGPDGIQSIKSDSE